MPVKVRKLPEGGFRVYDGRRIAAFSTTKIKVQRQADLLRGVKHGFRPRRRR